MFHYLFTTDAFECREGWVQHDESCYLYSHDKQTWHLSEVNRQIAKSLDMNSS